MRVVLILLFLSGINQNVRGQTNDEILLMMYNDTCNALIHLFPSDTSSFCLSKFLESHKKCDKIFSWMSSNNFDIKCKTMLLVAIEKINSDPAYKIERFIELDSIMKYSFETLQIYRNEPDLIKTMETELKSNEPIFKRKE